MPRSIRLRPTVRVFHCRSALGKRELDCRVREGLSSVAAYLAQHGFMADFSIHQIEDAVAERPQDSDQKLLFSISVLIGETLASSGCDAPRF